MPALGSVAQFVWVSSHRPKGLRFDSHPGHVYRFAGSSPSQYVYKKATNWCFFFTLMFVSLSLPSYFLSWKAVKKSPQVRIKKFFFNLVNSFVMCVLGFLLKLLSRNFLICCLQQISVLGFYLMYKLHKFYFSYWGIKIDILSCANYLSQSSF